ncbi:MAG TPA: glycoside hydrolase family 2 TIM barrel-domain containing protein [Candidatus Acidoferrales bacterium]|nr:glycoside hydrolase family 2 TIM barrel-domain containing protein [Candidatus Acidoferrales bacterium]
MNRFLPICVLLFMNLGVAEVPPRIEIPINDNWKFSKGDFPGAQNTNFNDSGWDKACLPHTWNNLDGQDGGNYYRGPGWYRKSLLIAEEYSSKRVFVRFGAAGMIADVYVNGKFVGEHRGGFAAFVFDITDFLIPGRSNFIAVKVDNTSPQTSDKFKIPPLSADFTMDGGLYRTAKLIVTNDVHISLSDYGSPGVYISQNEVSDTSAKISVMAKLANESKKAETVSVRTSVYDAEGNLVSDSTGRTEIPGNSNKDFTNEFKIDKPHLWNGRIDPYLYKVVVSVYRDNELVDRVDQPLGLRYYSVDPEKGFILNGKPYKLHGVALHEDKKDKGRAITGEDRMQEMKYIVDIGATMVRFAHYQYDQEMYRLCDKNGIVVWTEIPIVNQIDSSELFEENAKKQLIELIRQNYNHPSVLFWGIFNEIHNVKGPDPLELIKKLDSLARDEDVTRLTTAASNDEGSANSVTSVLGLNQYFGWYRGKAQDLGEYLDTYHKEHPDRAIGLSEYGGGGSVYQHEENPKQPRPDGPWHPEEYQTYLHEVSWKAIESRPFIWFSTLWNMFDFASDSRREGFQPGINDKGIISQDHETKKDSYYWYKVNWNPEPMVHINSKRFMVRDTSMITVEVYSNAKETELFVNGKSAGKIASGDHRFFWNNVSLNKGSNYVKAVAIIDGKEYFDECWWRYQR